MQIADRKAGREVEVEIKVEIEVENKIIIRAGDPIGNGGSL